MTDQPWITVIGIGEDGLKGLSPALCTLIMATDVLVGGDRHHEKVPDFTGERLTWAEGFGPTLDEIETRRGQQILVLASGDPLHYGVGATLARRFGADALRVFPAPGAFSLAAARMGWSIPDCQLVTIHGRPLDVLALHFNPGARLLVLSRDGGSPAEVAALMTNHGYGDSTITVLEHLGGPQENRMAGRASDWAMGRAAELNTLAIDCVGGENTATYTRAPGLPDDAFEHDGQLTKREVRAATLAALQSLPGQMLWDLGAGSGSVAIEWLRLGGERKAVAFESNATRVARMARNALNLGVPSLKIIEGRVPGVLPTVLPEVGPAPDAIFIGGGVSEVGVLAAAWDALKSGGRLVANGVTIEAEQALVNFQNEHGGELVRIGIERAAPIGGKIAFRPLLRVTQFAATKS